MNLRQSSQNHNLFLKNFNLASNQNSFYRPFHDFPDFSIIYFLKHKTAESSAVFIKKLLKSVKKRLSSYLLFFYTPATLES